MQTGTIRFFNAKEGYGVISRSEPDRDVFVHVPDARLPTLEEGAEVAFEVTIGERGPRALTVRRIDSD